MRGGGQNRLAMFSYISPEARVPKDHPLRPIRVMVDNALANLAPLFKEMHSHTGRPSIPPEHLLRALLPQTLYSIRSERMLIEQLDYNLLIRRFVGLPMDDKVWDHSTFSKNRDRLIAHDVPTQFLSQSGGRQKRKDETYQSATDPKVRVYSQRGKDKGSKLSFMVHALMESRIDLPVESRLDQATGTAELEAALPMAENLPGAGRITPGTDRGGGGAPPPSSAACAECEQRRRRPQKPRGQPSTSERPDMPAIRQA